MQFSAEGETFGYWTITGPPVKLTHEWFYPVECVCGTASHKVCRTLHAGLSRSCGCIRWRPIGESRTVTYRRWVKMKDRTNSNSAVTRKNYKDRGIGVCARWLCYRRFLEDMGPCPSREHSLDRLDNSRGYEPGNCRWATRTEQARNKRSNRTLRAFGETKPVSAWAEDPRCCVKYGTLLRRIVAKWDAVRAITQPPQATGRWTHVDSQ